MPSQLFRNPAISIPGYVSFEAMDFRNENFVTYTIKANNMHRTMYFLSVPLFVAFIHANTG